ncbi:MAG: tripartite tricarboxylate transporter TctB family protein [Xanthobacteraceae bacterium]
MSKPSETAVRSGPAHRTVEIGVALFTAIFALVVIAGSLKAGKDWAFDGPRAGFFPFYIGVSILIASVVNLIRAVIDVPKEKLFADWTQLRRVVSVLVPLAIYVAAISWVGIYLASAGLIAIFMKWLGRYGWLKVAAYSIAIPIIVFIVFEKYFLVPLPKGAIERWLGF